MAVLVTSLVGCGQDSDNYDLNGKPINFSELQGKWFVINYFADWCGSCVDQIENLNQLHQSGITVFGVDFDGHTSNELRKIADAKNIKYPVLAVNPKEKFGIGEVNSIPVMFLVNPEGKIVKEITGLRTKEELMLAMQE